MRQPRICHLLLLAACLVIAADHWNALPAVQAGHDERTGIALDRAEREQMLAGMRVYLESIQQTVAALAANRLDQVPLAAKTSGAKMLETVSPATALKLPAGFMSLSFDTHDKWDKLAEKASKQPSRAEVLKDLEAIMANCTSCHASFRLLTQY